MLRYFAQGRIRWKNGMRCNTRTNWEFYAVVKGRCGLRFSDRAQPTLHSKKLLVFAPQCSHGWSDDGQHTFHRIVFHFASVPYPLDEIVNQKGWLGKDLSDADLTRLLTLATELEPHFRHPTLLSQLYFQQALVELSLMLVGDGSFASLPPTLTDLANFKVERAVSWFAEHFAQNPSVKEVAEAIHVSPSHLRRLFWQVRKSSPKALFRRMRLEKAKELMGRSALTLDDVAAHCGYSSASHLCRDCRAMHRFSPTRWRKKLVDRFVQPLPANVVPVREFSARPEERTMPA